jgi:hypothetical protein
MKTGTKSMFFRPLWTDFRHSTVEASFLQDDVISHPEQSACNFSGDRIEKHPLQDDFIRPPIQPNDTQ